MRHAQIENGVVVNVILVNDPADLPGFVLVASETAGIGDTYADGVFTAPPPPGPVVPQEITMRQARLVLLGAGLLSSVQGAIDGLPSPQKEAAQIEWEYSNTLQRRNPFVLTLGPALGLTAEQIDALFIQGATL
jgi:hypothetical protein